LPKFHFISGLPRSGSTLLAAILAQNPAFHAAMSSPVFAVFNACITAMGGNNEFSLFLDQDKRRRILQGIFDGYYSDLGPDQVAFDTNRMWTLRLPAIKTLYPQAKIICCVRNPAWIMDSIEVLVRKNALDASRLFNTDAERLTVFSRCEALLQRNRLVGSAHLALKEAYFSAEASSMLMVDYDILAARPEETLRLIYGFLQEPWFAHDFDHVSYQAESFDTQLLADGLHRIEGRVEAKPRQTVLPPDLFKTCSEMVFWHGASKSTARHIVPRSAKAGA
jgi:sulfotransferase